MEQAMIITNNFLPFTLFFVLIGAGALLIWYQGTKSYDKGIREAVLMHREGRLTYSDYIDDDGVTMVDIQIAPIEDSTN